MTSIDDVIGYRDGVLLKHCVQDFWRSVYGVNQYRAYVNKPIQLLIPFPQYTKLYTDEEIKNE